MQLEGLKQLVLVSDSDFLSLPEKLILANSQENDFVIFPYMYQGHFAFESALNERKCLIYDSNPLVKINFESEFFYPSLFGIKARLDSIKVNNDFTESNAQKYLNPRTYIEVLAIKNHLSKANGDAIDLWIKRLVCEALKIPPTIPQNPNEIAYLDIKAFILKMYKNIYSNLDPMKTLILHTHIPQFITEENIDSKLKGGKCKIAFYAPYQFNAKEYFKNNFLKMWFCDIDGESLVNNSPQNKQEWDNKCKKDFAFIHKRLESGGIIYVEKTHEEEVYEFFKMALFYSYTNFASFTNQKGDKVFVFKKS